MKAIKRAEPRTALMALVELSWQEPSGIANVTPARMEDTSPSGACIRLPRSIRTGSEVTVKRRSEEFLGITRYCRRDGAEYVLGLRRISKEAAAQAHAQAPPTPVHAAAPAHAQAPASAQAHVAINAANFNSSASANATANAGVMQQPPVPVPVPVTVPVPVPVPVPAPVSDTVPATLPSYVTAAPQPSVPPANAPPATVSVVAMLHAEQPAPAPTQPRVPDLAPPPAPLPHSPIEDQVPAPAPVPPQVPPQGSPQVEAQVHLRTEPSVFAEGQLQGDALTLPHPSAFTRMPAPVLAEPHVPNLPQANYDVPLSVPVQAPAQESDAAPTPPPIRVIAQLPVQANNAAPPMIQAPLNSESMVAKPAATKPEQMAAPSQHIVAAVPSPVGGVSALASQENAVAPAPPLPTVPAVALRENVAAPVRPPLPAQLQVVAAARQQNATKVGAVSLTSVTRPVAPAPIAPIARSTPPPARQEAALAKIPVPAASIEGRAIPVPEMKHAQQITQNKQLSTPKVMQMHTQDPTPDKDKERKAMSPKWMNLTLGRQKQAPPNGNTSSLPVAMKAKPAAASDAAVADEIHNDSGTMGRGRARPQGDLQSMDDIYRGAGIMAPRMGYSATKIVEMLESSHMRGLSSEAKRAAVLMALDAASISVSEVERDARRRQDALDAYEADQRKCFEEYWTRKSDVNAQIQAEIDWLTARSMDRIKRNLDDIAAEKAEFARWHTMKQQEAARISEAVALCAKPSATGTLAAASAASPLASSSAAASAAAAAEPAGGLSLALAEVEHAAKPA